MSASSAPALLAFSLRSSSLSSPSRQLRRWALPVLLSSLLALPLPLLAQGDFCGAGKATAESESSDADNAVSDLSLQHYANQPHASGLFCFYGYAAEKCGDHQTAHRIYDRCIAAGHPGAMIWKALLLEDGSGVARDPVQATALLRQAALSGNDGYATLGKLHYASALYRGHGVRRDVAAAMHWFRQAAAEGNPEARDFLRTGYHVGERDAATHGIGRRPEGAAAAAAAPRPSPPPAVASAAHLATPAAPTGAAAVRLKAGPPEAVAAASTPAAAVRSPAAAIEATAATGQVLRPRESLPTSTPSGWRDAVLALVLLLLVSVSGWWRQGRWPAGASAWAAPVTS